MRPAIQTVAKIRMFGLLFRGCCPLTELAENPGEEFNRA